MCWSCCGDVCVCVRERKLSRTEGVCSLARYHVNVLCFLSTCFCKTREPLSARLKPGHGGRAQWCSLPGVHSYRRYCWPRPSGARLWGAPLWEWRDRSETVRNVATHDFIIHSNFNRPFSPESKMRVLPIRSGVGLEFGGSPTEQKTLPSVRE